MPAFKRMASGKYIDMMDFRPEDVDINDISQSLNCLYRFTGHHKDKKPLTVAQHTWLTMELSGMIFGEPEVTFDCLLHDMPECYYGDMATPWKKILGDQLRKLQDVFDEAVYLALWKIGIPFDEEIENKRKICDRLSLDIERRNMWKSQHGKDKWPEVPSFYLSLEEKERLFDQAQSIEFVDLEKIWREFKV